jgi:hypothetical protein
MGADHQEEDAMPKFLLLKHYAGRTAPMTEWTPDEVEAHMQFQRDLVQQIADNGELVRVDALTGPDLARVVIYGGPGAAPVVTDGPFPESKEFLAGYFMIDVNSAERAYEIAAQASAAPGAGGVPFNERIEVREVMWTSPAGDS